MAGMKNAISERIVDQTLVVIGENECVHILERIGEASKEFFFGIGSEWVAALLRRDPMVERVTQNVLTRYLGR